MKNKLLAILAAFVVVTPLTAVKAEDIDYSIGNERNFFVNKQQEDAHAAGGDDGETVGIKMISLGNDPEAEGYVLGLATGAATVKGYGIYDKYSAYSSSNMPTKFEDSESYKKMVEDFNGSISNKLGMDGKDLLKYDTAVTTPYVRNFNTDSKNIRLPKSTEVLSWFDNTKLTDTKYELTADGIKKFEAFYKYSYPLIATLDLIYNTEGLHYYGYVLGDDPVVDSSAGDIYAWVMKFTYDATNTENPKITSVTVERISNNASISNKESWVMVPILSFNKTYDCKFETKKKTACFKCGDEYQWLVVGEQASTCSIVSSVTSKAKCVDNPPTGVEDYVLEFAIAAGICGIVLLAVKRKSLFTRI